MMETWTAMVTGASSGLGEAYARALAPKVRRLVLVARREDRLVLLRAELVAAHATLEEVRICRADLADAADRDRLADGACREIDLLVNNAGLGDYGDFAGSDWERNRAMIEVNVTALTRLAHAVVPGMRRRGRGAILNVSSLAGEVFIPDFAVYAATKAYVTRFSEGLRLEVRGDGIAVVAVCPGPVRTEFGEVARRAGQKKSDLPLYSLIYARPEQVVEESLAALVSGRARVFPSWRVKLVAAGLRLLPLWADRLILGRRPRKSSGDG
jgi:short-subunit dehydrogenase